MEDWIRRQGLRAIRWGVVPLVALGVLWVFLRDPGVTGFFAAGFNHMIYGTAYKPYVYRALLPWMTRLTLEAAFLPWDGRTALYQAVAGSPGLTRFFAMLRFDPRFAAEHLVSTALMYGGFLGFAAAVRRLVTAFYRTTELVAEVAPVVALLGLTTMFNYANYIYDPFTLLFSALLLLLVALGKWRWFMAAYVVSLFNKETTVVFAALFLIHNLGRMPRGRYLAVAAVLVVTFAVSRVVLNRLYSHNGGAFTIVQLLGHNLALFHVYPPSSFVTAGVLLALVFGHFDAKPGLLKEGLLMAPPLLGACFVWGFFDELRDYYEVYPVLFLLALPSVGHLTGFEATAAHQAPRAPLMPWLRGARPA